MSNSKNYILSENEYVKKVLTPLYRTESREVIIYNSQKQKDELLNAEKRIKAQMDEMLLKYINQ